jgi:hypothetical protein
MEKIPLFLSESLQTLRARVLLQNTMLKRCVGTMWVVLILPDTSFSADSQFVGFYHIRLQICVLIMQI